MPARPSNEAVASGLACAAALAIFGAWVAGRAARDALFLATFPVELLPRMMLAAAIVSLLAAVGFARLLERFAPARVIPFAFVVSAALFGVEWLLARSGSPLAPFALYLHFGATGGVLISGFFAVLNERWDPYRAKTVLSRAGAFGALGLVVGGLAAERTSAIASGVSPLLLGLAFAHVVCALGVLVIGSPGAPAKRSGSGAAPGGSGLAMVRRTSLLRNMAALVVLMAGVEMLLDYAVKAAAAERFADEASLLRFFALFEMSVGGIAFAVQLAMGGWVLHRFGLGWAMAVRPVLVLLTSLGGAVFARFSTVVLARAADDVTQNSTYTAGFELLYTPLSPEVKRPAKPVVDVVADRVGQISGAVLILLLVAILPSLPRALVLGLVATASGLALLLIARIQRRYEGLLAESLKSGAVSLEAGEILDAVTSRTVFGTSGGIDRDELMAQIESVRANQAQERAAEEAAVVARGEDLDFAAARRELFGRLDALDSGDPARVRATLNAARDDLRLVAHAIPLLRDGPCADPALVFLRAVGPRVVGQLIDALVDPDLDLAVRRQIPRALEVCRSRRSVEGLCLGIEDHDFEVRLGCARAAARVIARQEQLRLPLGRVQHFVERELTAGQLGEAGERPADDAPVLFDRQFSSRVALPVEHLFTLLALALGPELMAATVRSLYGTDAHLRGTALEYLQTKLPDGLRAVLWPHIPGASGAVTPKRSEQQIADELMKTARAVQLREEG